MYKVHCGKIYEISVEVQAACIMVTIQARYGHLYSGLKLEVRGEDITRNIVVVSPLNQPFSLHACVHGSPAVLVIPCQIFHESPHRTVSHCHWTFVTED